ncbi:uncharacterized protein N7506_000229 [Penicillium brevicompactum]|uniref:uncharacterized protein n=1 Tax=Penicillium brevicompactum TaxID=5074 RepID=UPI002541E883|nr:uncharacterized protein N7506_000229 [Penicillium brevicompactum]KAJ5346976.1 hypothetical protein N7506_000229 [Penicillium brevicompactum]
MHANAISVLAAFLAVGNVHFGAAQHASEAHVDQPHWNSPREVERTSRNETQRKTHSESGLVQNGLLDNLMQTHGSSPQPAVTPTPESSPAIQTQKGRENFGVTISVNHKSPDILRLTIDNTTISSEPSASTATTTKTESPSSRNIPMDNSTAASTTSKTIIMEKWTVESSPNISTRASSTISTTSSTHNPPNGLATGLGNLIDGSTSSATSSTASTVTAAAALPTKTSTSLASTKSNNPSTAIVDDLRSSLDFLLGSSTSSFVTMASNGSGFSSLESVNSAGSSNISGWDAASSTANIAGLDHLDHFGLGDNSSIEKNITPTVFSSTAIQSIILLNVSASTTSSLSITSTPIGTSSSSNLLNELISSLDSQYSTTSFGTVDQRRFFPCAGGNTGILTPTSTNPIETVHISYLPSLNFISASGIESSSGMKSSPGPANSTSTSSTGTEASTGMLSSMGTESSSAIKFGIDLEYNESIRSSTASGPSSLFTPSLEDLTLSYHSSFPPIPTFTNEMSTAQSSEEYQSKQSPAFGLLTSKKDWMPSTILILPDLTATVSSTSEQTKEPKATSLPGSIIPLNEITEAPSDSVLLQFGFDSQLPWSFVINTPLSSSQIFNYTPQAIENALPSLSSNDSPVMFSLEPYYNWQSTGYNATLATFYFSRDKVDLLRALKVNPDSALYNQASETLRSLMSKVDPTIPLEFYGNYPSGVGDPRGGGSNGNNEGGRDSRSSGGIINTDGSASSSKTNPTSIGIGVGAVASAAAYGAGMFWIARRYRKRKQLHQHLHSTSKQVNQGGSAPGPIPAAGDRASGRGSRGTTRFQTISGPAMVENSLGWN